MDAGPRPEKLSTPAPTSFVNGRYRVKTFPAEGNKKKVYLAHDSVLDRNIAFALMKNKKLDFVIKEFREMKWQISPEPVASISVSRQRTQYNHLPEATPFIRVFA